jgi:hypothetical protein
MVSRLAENWRGFSQKNRATRLNHARPLRGLSGQHVPPRVRREEQRGAGFKKSDFGQCYHVRGIFIMYLLCSK